MEPVVGMRMKVKYDGEMFPHYYGTIIKIKEEGLQLIMLQIKMDVDDEVIPVTNKEFKTEDYKMLGTTKEMEKNINMRIPMEGMQVNAIPRGKRKHCPATITSVRPPSSSALTAAARIVGLGKKRYQLMLRYDTGDEEDMVLTPSTKTIEEFAPESKDNDDDSFSGASSSGGEWESVDVKKVKNAKKWTKEEGDEENADSNKAKGGGKRGTTRAKRTSTKNKTSENKTADETDPAATKKKAGETPIAYLRRIKYPMGLWPMGLEVLAVQDEVKAHVEALTNDFFGGVKPTEEEYNAAYNALEREFRSEGSVLSMKLLKVEAKASEKIEAYIEDGKRVAVKNLCNKIGVMPCRPGKSDGPKEATPTTAPTEPTPTSDETLEARLAEEEKMEDAAGVVNVGVCTTQVQNLSELDCGVGEVMGDENEQLKARLAEAEARANEVEAASNEQLKAMGAENEQLKARLAKAEARANEANERLEVTLKFGQAHIDENVQLKARLAEAAANEENRAAEHRAAVSRAAANRAAANRGVAKKQADQKQG